MKISCDIINDLLPLYVEGLASEDTRKAVEEHVTACSSCRKNLEKMRKPEQNAAVEDIPVKKVKAALQRQRLKAIALTAVIILILAVSAIAYLTTPEYLPIRKICFLSVKKKTERSLLLSMKPSRLR